MLECLCFLHGRGYPPEHSPGQPSIYLHEESGSPVRYNNGAPGAGGDACTGGGGAETTIKLHYHRSPPGALRDDNASSNTRRAQLGSDDDVDDSQLSSSREVKVRTNYNVM